MMADSVIVPLYIYPSVGAWDPVLNIASEYSGVQFTAVVNIHNGPGDGALPNEEYSDAISVLNSLNNVRTIGYVATTWCSRDLDSVIDEIGAYSFWGEYDPALALDGIFVDETPTNYSPDLAAYLRNITQAVYSSTGLKDNYIVHNPGALPEAPYFDESNVGPVDSTIVFENTFSNWTSQYFELLTATQLYNRDRLAVILHTVPELDPIDTLTTLREVLGVGHSVWMTGSQDYTQFDAIMPTFIHSFAKLLK